MKYKIYFLLVCLLFGSRTGIRAQEKSNCKFGKISAADFNVNAMKLDSGAGAVIIADIGNTTFEGNNDGGFTLIFTRYMRVKIIDKKGLDIGSQEISLYHGEGGRYEKLFSQKGSTYTLENGAITETRLDEKSIFTQKYNEDIDEKKFSMPALKPGAIFELQYTVKSPFEFHLRPWTFQGAYPTLWSEYEVTIPPPFHYVMKILGDTNYYIHTAKTVPSNYSIRYGNGTAASDMMHLSGEATNARWVKKNVPVLREEPFATTLENYNAHISFQLNYFQWNNESERHEFMSTWLMTSKKLLADESFGVALSRDNGWMADELQRVIQGSNSPEEKTRKIFCYVRDNFKAIDKNGYSKQGLYTQNTLKEVFKRKDGNVAEINLLMIAMLRKAGIDADPVVLSTRDHGTTSENYPLISEYNYVIGIVKLQDRMVMLDASVPFNGFSHLPENCYNGWGHVISETMPRPVTIAPDSIRESRVTNVIIMNDEKGNVSGSFNSLLGRNASYALRNEMTHMSVKKYGQNLATALDEALSLENFGIDSLDTYDEPVTIHYEFNLKNVQSADIFYFNPILGDIYKSNPFKSMDRHYPVEIPYRIDELYLLNMDVPAGFSVDELPKSVRVAYNDKEGLFEYLIQKSDNTLQMRVHLKLDKCNFQNDEYPTLRDFFANVVKKENEQIVFRKNKL